MYLLVVGADNMGKYLIQSSQSEVVEQDALDLVEAVDALGTGMDIQPEQAVQDGVYELFALLQFGFPDDGLPAIRLHLQILHPLGHQLGQVCQDLEAVHVQVA